MQLSTRFGLVGVGGLALLTAVQWVRQQHLQLDPFGAYLIGVSPNFAAAIAITFVLLSAWLDQAPGASGLVVRLRFQVSAVISGAGLIGWEFVQMFSRTLVFDWQDVFATLAGIAVSVLLFAAASPGDAREAEPG